MPTCREKQVRTLLNAYYLVAVVGSGSAGKDAALLAARAGLSTALIEAGSLGGTGLHRGCDAVRALRACASQYDALIRSSGLGLHLGLIGTDWANWLSVQRRTSARLTEGLSRELDRAKVEVRFGQAAPASSITWPIPTANSLPRAFQRFRLHALHPNRHQCRAYKSGKTIGCELRRGWLPGRRHSEPGALSALEGVPQAPFQHSHSDLDRQVGAASRNGNCWRALALLDQSPI